MLFRGCSDEVGDRYSKGDGARELEELEQGSASGSVWAEMVEVLGSAWVSTEQDFGGGFVYVDLFLILGACSGGLGAGRGGKSSWGWKGAGTRFQLLGDLSGG